MYKDKIVAVVMPAYNAAETLEKTFLEIPKPLVDHVILCDDASSDQTIAVAKKLGIEELIVHSSNKGYGGNQKSLYNRALELGSDIVIMLHPDYQYTPMLIPSMVNIIGDGLYPVVLGSRILGKGALQGGMPIYKYIANRILTAFQNLVIRYKLSEYHTGYRAFSKEVLESIRFNDNSDDFIFDNEMLSQIIYAGYDIAEITCPTKYFEEASSINFKRSSIYGLGVIQVSLQHALSKIGILKHSRYQQ